LTSNASASGPWYAGSRYSTALYWICLAVLMVACAPKALPSSDPSAEYKSLNDQSASFYHAGMYEQALDAAERAILSDPDHPFAWNNKGVALLALGKYDAALEAVSRSIDLNSDNPIAWNSKGAVLQAMGKIPEAIEAGEQALLRDPANAVFWYNMACYRALQGDHAAARKDLQAALERDPSLKALAAADKDLNALKDDTEFRKLTE
jgi:tetratricopeptide (TPR) repeat protein